MLPTLNTARLIVEHMAPGHAEALADFFRRNEQHLATSSYLFIDGAWRDHVLTARLNPAFDASIFNSRPFRPA